MKQDNPFNLELIVESLNDGVYVTDLDRRIIYWSKSAERITGFNETDIIGKRCCDNILNHIDKDDHHLCGKEHCPLHRSMVTGQRTTVPVIVYACSKNGDRIPMQVSVAPVRDDNQEIIGGVEIFRDLTETIGDLERAKKIQMLSMNRNTTADDRIRFTTHYIPHDMIGGDFYMLERLDDDRYAFFLADVIGHGVAAALYTMHLKSLWEENKHILHEPQRFMKILNSHFYDLVPDKGAFSAGILCIFDIKNKELQCIPAGNPQPFIIRNNGEFETIECVGPALGLIKDCEYQSTTRYLEENEKVLLFTDGAIEVMDANHAMLDKDGLIQILRQLGYPAKSVSFKEVEKSLLKYSGGIRLDDDLTFVEMHFLGSTPE